MEFGEKIKMLRLQQGLTLEQVGDRVGVGKSTVRKWESGQIANMRRDKIAALAKALGVTPQYLMGWTEPKGEEADREAELLALREELRRRPEMHTLFSLSKKATPAQVRQAIRFLEAIQNDEDE